jgi:RNA polymerase sigma-70 factor (ECF subfamily)
MTGPSTPSSFRDHFTALFDARFEGLYRYLDRLSGEPELAADLAQEAFVRLYQRGSLPDAPDAWLITVAMNLFRNARSMQTRRRRLLTVERAQAVLADPAPSPAHVAMDVASSTRVRAALDQLPEREQQLLLLRAEGYSYREISAALDVSDASIGTLLARAKRAFREAYDDEPDAS